MKHKGMTALCALLCALLTLSAVALGAWRGWQGERRETLSAFTANAAMTEYLEERAMDAANLRVVAQRHLPAEDADVAALQQARKTLTEAGAEVEALAAADAALTRTAASLGQRLPQLDSVQRSSRDQAYVTTLTRALMHSENIMDGYNAQVEAFNTRLNTSFTGWIARLLGVQPLSPYGAV